MVGSILRYGLAGGNICPICPHQQERHPGKGVEIHGKLAVERHWSPKLYNLVTLRGKQNNAHAYRNSITTVPVIIKVTFRFSATIVALRYGFWFRLVMAS